MAARLDDVVFAYAKTRPWIPLVSFLIGVLPTYAQVGLLAPALLTGLRLIQGLALGGEYGGAAVYVAEHAPETRRGLFTSFIQTTATLGLFLALGVILATRQALGDAAFAQWGWRIPFLLSAVLMGVSVYIRLSLHESPLFQAMKAAGRTSHAPLTESFANRKNWRVIAIAFFGAAAGQAAVWYTGQFYALLFLQTVLKVEYATAYTIIAIALAIATPGFVFFGWLSDRVGRKPIMMAGNLLSALTIYPIYRLMASQVQDGVPNVPALVACVVALVLLVTMVYGPIAAWLVEAFPARIRYTSLSLPYHVANGYIGGFTPLIATALQTRTGSPFAGLWWPIGVAALTFVVGSLYLPETRDARLWEEALGPDATKAPPGD